MGNISLYIAMIWSLGLSCVLLIIIISIHNRLENTIDQINEYNRIARAKFYKLTQDLDKKFGNDWRT